MILSFGVQNKKVGWFELVLVLLRPQLNPLRCDSQKAEGKIDPLPQILKQK